MSNKPHDKLNALDARLRKVNRYGMGQGVLCTIEHFYGFELFNTRRFHNYETWSDGYRVFNEDVYAEAEDLDDAIRAYALVMENLNNGELPDEYGRYPDINWRARVKRDSPRLKELKDAANKGSSDA